jgi:hypothetical protein
MRIKSPVVIAVSLACALWLGAGCVSAPRATNADGAATPQDKAHQQQLAGMSGQDADASETAASRKSSRPADRTVPGRRTGQMVIDQPTGRHR